MKFLEQFLGGNNQLMIFFVVVFIILTLLIKASNKIILLKPLNEKKKIHWEKCLQGVIVWRVIIAVKQQIVDPEKDLIFMITLSIIAFAIFAIKYKWNFNILRKKTI